MQGDSDCVVAGAVVSHARRLFASIQVDGACLAWRRDEVHRFLGMRPEKLTDEIGGFA
jgi:hypothetical protein